jgi:hypothetical protein
MANIGYTVTLDRGRANLLKAQTAETLLDVSRFLYKIPFLMPVLLGLTLFAHSQEQHSAAGLPEAPSQTASQGQPSSMEFQTGIEAVDVLMSTSLFFPNLATNTHSLSSADKFKLFARSSISGSAILGTLAGAGFAQAANSPEGYGQGGEGYAKRFGSGMARNASNQFFGNFLLASALHQDPRYFLKPTSSFKQAVRYSVRRVFITRSDSGQQVTNWSGLIGPLLGEGLANAYMPPDAQTVGHTFGRYGTDIGVFAGGNILRQYWPTIVRALHLPHQESTSRVPAPGAAPNR